jgi:hypothetical protein
MSEGILHRVMREAILKQLELNKGDRIKTAFELGISIRTLRLKLNLYRTQGRAVHEYTPAYKATRASAAPTEASPPRDATPPVRDAVVHLGVGFLPVSQSHGVLVRRESDFEVIYPDKKSDRVGDE